MATIMRPVQWNRLCVSTTGNTASNFAMKTHTNCVLPFYFMPNNFHSLLSVYSKDTQRMRAREWVRFICFPLVQFVQKKCVWLIHSSKDSSYLWKCIMCAFDLPTIMEKQTTEWKKSAQEMAQSETVGVENWSMRAIQKCTGKKPYGNCSWI